MTDSVTEIAERLREFCDGKRSAFSNSDLRAILDDRDALSLGEGRMTDINEARALAERLAAYAKDQGGWHNIDDTCEAASTTILALLDRLVEVEKERDKAHRQRVEALDKLHGTPCEQIRHQQEMETVQASLATATEALREIAEKSMFSSKDRVVEHARAALASIAAGTVEHPADWSELPKDLFVTSVKRIDNIIWEATVCNVPMAIGPEVHYVRAGTVEHPDSVRLREAVEVMRWLNRKGGLGLDVHGRIDAFLAKLGGTNGQ